MVAYRRLWLFVVIAGAATDAGRIDAAVTEYRDTLDVAVAAPEIFQSNGGDRYGLYATDNITYDDNLYRLPANVTDLSSLIGPNATRQDHINTATLGLDKEWDVGRQTVDVDLRADDNRFARNTNLNNISGNDKILWNWSLGGVFSGEIGAHYFTALPSFVNTDVYSKNLVTQTEYFASGRYELGPRWSAFGGVLDSNTRLSAAESKVNDSDRKAVDFGLEYATNIDNSVGLDYRYTDTRYPNSSILNGISSDTNYTEDRMRFLFRYAFSDKSLLVASAGYLKRYYPTVAIGDFSGDIWRVLFQWQPTDKTQLDATAWRDLRADLTAQTNYFVSNGGSISPAWSPSDKFKLSFMISLDDQDFIGPNLSGSILATPIIGPRHDRVAAEQATFTYTPIVAVVTGLSFRQERRSSNESNLQYEDKLASASVTIKF